MRRTVLFALMLMALLSFTAMAQRGEVNYTPKQTEFRTITLPQAQAVTLRLYEAGLGGKAYKTVKMKGKKSADHTLWSATVKGNLNGKFYTFEVTQGGKKLGECAGVFARAVGVNGQRGAVIDFAATNPDGWSRDVRPAIAWSDLVLYEMHHRDFSIDPSGGFAHPGKFLALTEPRALRHLQELGVNAVHILPSFDYASVDETRLDTPQYNWGYDPVNYNVPEGGYSTDPYRPEVRVREFKQMVKALHDAGIKVILDVVYNHTFDIAGSNFQKMMPDYFYRKTADGNYSNGSGCGNETASEREFVRAYIVESVKYWVEEYHIDGFRFDLMGVHDIATMNAVRRELPSDIFIYGEGWSAGGCAIPNEELAMKANISRMPGIAAFSDEIRDGLRGPWDGDDKAAFLGRVKGNEESVKYGIVGGIKHPQVDLKKVNYTDEAWATEPTQLIAYVSCHDDMCLVDRLKASIPGITTDELIRLDLLAQTAVFTSQGVPFMLSGEEMLRDKKGVHNSYNSPDDINHLDWNNLTKYPQVMAYYKGLIALRKHHPAFHMGNAQEIVNKLEFIESTDLTVAFKLKNHAGGDSWNTIYVVLNANTEPRVLAVDDGHYTIVCCDGVIDENGLETVDGSQVIIPAQSALIMHD
ncbi:MAG: type I pullulanase [Muribaculaceae bacterium]|nr:type I pullulanase [Muribaculaceae bacterium]